MAIGFTLLVLLGAAGAGGAVRIDDLWKEARPALVAVDLDEDADREETERFVRGFRDQFLAGAEILDLRAPPADAAKRLRAGFVFFGTSGGRTGAAILRGTFGAAQLGTDAVALPALGVRAPGRDLRLMFVGRNPVPRGQPVIAYLAPSNRLLQRINDLDHGSQSLHLYAGSSPLHVAQYDRRFRPLPERFSRTDALADARHLFATIEAVHPDPRFQLGGPGFAALAKRTLGEVERLAGQGKVPVRALARTLHRAAAQVGDGHTRLYWRRPLTTINAGDSRYPPFVLAYQNGEYRVRAAAGSRPGLVGQTVAAIEGQPTEGFLSELLALCAGETAAARASTFEQQQPLFWYLSGLLDGRARLRFAVDDRAGRRQELGAPPLSFAEFSALVEASVPGRPRAPSYRFLGDVGYFQYPRFEASDEHRAIISALFEQLEQRRSQALIMDLRGNGGGNSAISDFLLGFLTDRPVRQYARIVIKVSRQVHDRLSSDLRATPIGQIVVRDIAERPVPPAPRRFRGRFYLLTDAGTFSSASDFAAIVRGYHLGTLIGHETGGVPTSYGDMYQSELPHSRLTLGVSFKRFEAPVPAVDHDRHGLTPDVPATDATLRPFATTEDPVLSLALARARADLAGAPAR